jgi:uncharacterized membrane protein YoaK (UPF0700 family)
MNGNIIYYLGTFIGAFVFVIVLAMITRRLLKGKLPNVKGLKRVIIYLSVPLILAFILNTGNFIFYIVSVLIHGFFLYDQEKRQFKKRVVSV